MGDVINMREAVERIRERHKPGKLVGLYRGLRRSHISSEKGGWTSVANLAATIINQMIKHGSPLWWDLVDLDFSSMASPDSMRDEIGIRTLVGAVENGIDSPSFITIIAVTMETKIEQAKVEEMDSVEVSRQLLRGALAYGVPNGGFFPMFENMGKAIEEAGLKGVNVFLNGDHVRIRAYDPKEQDNHLGRVTSYDVIVDFKNLMRDIEMIRKSLASKEKE